jgi:hypothetical protein
VFVVITRPSAKSSGSCAEIRICAEHRGLPPRRGASERPDIANRCHCRLYYGRWNQAD